MAVGVIVRRRRQRAVRWLAAAALVGGALLLRHPIADQAAVLAGALDLDPRPVRQAERALDRALADAARPLWPDLAARIERSAAGPGWEAVGRAAAENEAAMRRLIEEIDRLQAEGRRPPPPVSGSGVD